MGSPVRHPAIAVVAVLTAACALGARGGEPVSRPGGPLEPPLVERVTLNCPGPLNVECDGAGNVAERDAWLADFRASANAACEPAEVSFRIVPGELVSTISYPDFADLSAWTLNGVTGVIPNPVMSGGRPVLRLTDNLSQSGTAFLSDTVSLSGDASFSASFSFQISNASGIGDGDGPGADGIAFVLQTVSDTAGGLGGGIGYEGIAPSLGVEFDTYNNGARDQNDGNHAGIDLNGNVTSIALAPVSPRFNDGGIWHAWVDFDGPTQLLEVRVSTDPLRPPAPLLQEVVDLVSVLGGTEAYVGFTSGTGAGGGWHDILSFYFSTVRDAQRCGEGAGVQTVIATASDACGDVRECARRFVIEDTDPPRLTAGTLDGCFSSVAEAEAAALAAVAVHDLCSGPGTLTVETSGSCDATLTVTAVDGCGNSASVDLPARIDDGPPSLVPADPSLSCGDEWLVAATGWDGADAAPAVVAADGCGPVAVVNDRTAGGAEAADRYPCGRTRVRFTAEDDCGGVAECVLDVVVTPEPPPALGPVLRVSKDAAGRPELDWSLFGPLPPHALFTLLRQRPGSGLTLLELTGTVVAESTWTDPDEGPRVVFYDVRSLVCDGGLSQD